VIHLAGNFFSTSTFYSGTGTILTDVVLIFLFYVNVHNTVVDGGSLSFTFSTKGKQRSVVPPVKVWKIASHFFGLVYKGPKGNFRCKTGISDLEDFAIPRRQMG
jgi:hypothetical protein